LSWPSYEWARRLFEVGCKGELPEALLAQTWDTESLRDAVRWLRVFVAGLSGEGAVLPGTGRQLVLPAPAPLQLDSDLPGERPDEQLPPEGDKFSEKDVPPAFREGGKPAGAVLTAPYLEDSSNWLLNGPYLTKHYGQGKELTTHIKVARAKAYLYTELLVLRDQKTANEGEARH
jgi:hypothetical protein